MKAAVLHAAKAPLTIEEVQIEKPKGHEVLVRTAAAGLCHSDLQGLGTCEIKSKTPAPSKLQPSQTRPIPYPHLLTMGLLIAFAYYFAQTSTFGWICT